VGALISRGEGRVSHEPRCVEKGGAFVGSDQSFTRGLTHVEKPKEGVTQNTHRRKTVRAWTQQHFAIIGAGQRICIWVWTGGGTPTIPRGRGEDVIKVKIIYWATISGKRRDRYKSRPICYVRDGRPVPMCQGYPLRCSSNLKTFFPCSGPIAYHQGTPSVRLGEVSGFPSSMADRRGIIAQSGRETPKAPKGEGVER